MYRKWINIGILSFGTIALLSGCGSDNDSPTSVTVTKDNDMVYSVRVDDTTGFLNLANLTTQSSLNNSNGMEIGPARGVFTYKDYVYTTGSQQNDKLTKYSYTDNKLTQIKEVSVGENSMPTNITFVSDTKAYVSLGNSGELLVINPSDMTITKRINLSEYAMGENDTNPEISDGIIRDGKFYVGLAQIDSFQTYKCYGQASILIIDIETDAVLKHITDDRTCTAGSLDPFAIGFILDEKNDIYVNATGSYGYYPGTNAGYLRIKNGEDVFDSSYYFSITDKTDLDVPGGKASYSYKGLYMDNGIIYITLMIPGLTSSPPDYVNDKNYQPYKLDLYNQTLTKVDLPATNGWTGYPVKHNGEVLYGLSAPGGTGFFKIGSTTPDITTEGEPLIIRNLD